MSESIAYVQYLDESGHCHSQASCAGNERLLLDLYRQMVLTRIFDDKAVRLQRTGKMGTYPSSLGQEAVGVGAGQAMKAEDIYCPYYRDQAAMLCRGVTLTEILRYWSGDERGSDYQGPKQDFPISIPIASQLLHAAGAAYAVKLRNEGKVVVAMCGDGATSEGDFFETLNLASTWRLPLVIVINNNQWAISVPRHKQTATATLAQKALGFSIPGLQVDGNDVLAVYDTMSEAVNRAREGHGPQLIECLTYRLSDHTTADDARRYCPPDELESAWSREPIARLRQYLTGLELWNDSRESELKQEVNRQVDEAVEAVLSEKQESPAAMFDSLYEEFPEPLLDQYETVWNLDY